MPAVGNPPVLQDFLIAYSDAIQGSRSPTADTRRGSVYEVAGGPSAMVWSRQAQRDRRLFRAIYTDTAEGNDLDRLVEAKYQAPRIQATYGTGLCSVRRPSAGLSGWLYEGTRIEVRPLDGLPVTYAVAQDYEIQASDLEVPVSIRATRSGSGTSVKAIEPRLRITDEVFDPTLVPVSLVCGDGTDQEPKAQYVARARKRRQDRRNGYQVRIFEALIEAGADQVVLLDAGSRGPSADFGLSYAYVADAGWSTPDALKRACLIALDSVEVAGTDVQVLGMIRQTVSLSVAAHLVDDPGGFDQLEIKQGIVAAILEDFAARKNWWTFRLNALEGLARGSNRLIESVDITSTPAEPAAAFPDTLPRYSLAGGAITIALTGPT